MDQVPELWVEVSAKLSAGEVPLRDLRAKEASTADGSGDYAMTCVPGCPFCTNDPGPNLPGDSLRD